MRRRPTTLPLVVASILTSSLAIADVPTALGAGEVRQQLKGATDAAIGACYLDAVGARANAGKLEVVLAIHRKGLVDRIDVRAPGLPARTVATIDGCVRNALVGIKFPARRVGTTAVVPYFWQKTAALGAGPAESCWHATGCKDGDDGSIVTPKANRTITKNRQARRAPRA